MPSSAVQNPNTLETPQLFRATTLSPHTGVTSGLVSRQRVLSILDSNLEPGNISWLVGPIGSGKSTVALQWTQHRSVDVQYVSVGKTETEGFGKTHPPNLLGVALADLLNAVAGGVQEHSEELIRSRLARVIEVSKQERCSFILDDLERIGRPAMEIMQNLFPTALPELNIEHGIFISRTMDSNVFGSLQAVSNLRVVLPTTFEFDQEETNAAQELGIFGSASATQAEDARVACHGWISGMLSTLHGHGGETVDPSQLRARILNDLLAHQPRPVLHVMIASASLPWVHNGIWQRWFTHLNIPHWAIPSTISQLPTQINDPQTGRFEIVPIMRENLRLLGSITASDQEVRSLLEIGLRWYVETGHFAAASTLAADLKMEDMLLHALKPQCAAMAEVEDWTAIQKVLEVVPEHILLQDTDLTYWYFHGLIESDAWAEMKRLFDHVESSWSASGDEITRARAHMLRSWFAQILGDSAQAMKTGVRALEKFPKHYHRERLWAAEIVGTAAAMEGDTSSALEYSSEANFEMAHLLRPSRWWHNNAGATRYSWMAMYGRLNEAFEITHHHARTVDGSLRTRHLLLMAQIDIERLRLDSARSLLEEAESVMQPGYAQHHHYRAAMSNLARAEGDLERAAHHLTNSEIKSARRFDHYSREILLRARIAIEQGDPSAAEIYLKTAPSRGRDWPTEFGDADPYILHALILHKRRQSDDAIVLVRNAYDDATERQQIYFAVRAQAALAHIYHDLGEPLLYSRAVLLAEEASADSGMALAFRVFGEDVRTFRENTDITSAETHNRLPVASTPTLAIDSLTSREIEVLGYVAQSKSNKEIAETMYISVSTVKNHLASSFGKLGAKNRRSAVRIARDMGIIER